MPELTSAVTCMERIPESPALRTYILVKFLNSEKNVTGAPTPSIALANNISTWKTPSLIISCCSLLAKTEVTTKYVKKATPIIIAMFLTAMLALLLATIVR